MLLLIVGAACAEPPVDGSGDGTVLDDSRRVTALELAIDGSAAMAAALLADDLEPLTFTKASARVTSDTAATPANSRVVRPWQTGVRGKVPTPANLQAVEPAAEGVGIDMTLRIGGG